MKNVKRMLRLTWFSLITLCFLQSAAAQEPAPSLTLNENCVVSILNRSAQVRPDGSWDLPNIPAGFGPVRARATCVENGLTLSGQSDFFTIQQNRMNAIVPVALGAADPIPASLTVSSPAAQLEEAGQAVQLSVNAAFPDGSSADVTSSNAGTSYTVTNPLVATVSQDGLLTAVASGSVFVSASNDGALGTLQVQVVLGADSDGDGIPDDIELSLGLDPNDPVDALEDRDGDGLTNLQEFLLGTDLDNADGDSDGDGIPDVEEVIEGLDGFITNPQLADTDGDGIRDGLEIETGSDPTDPNSFNLGGALSSLIVTPSSVALIVNAIVGESTQQLEVEGLLSDGTMLDLTSTASGTNYISSDLNICNFGAEPGLVFGGLDGTCIVTVENSGVTAQVSVSVSTFSPTPLSFVAVPGFANNVDVNGAFAYVAAGATGLQVVSVSDPENLQIVGSLDTPGNANDVKFMDGKAYIADGIAGLQIIDVSDPANPVLLGSLDTPGEAWDLVLKGNQLCIADGASGLQLVDVTDPAAPNLTGSIDTPGTAKGVDADLLTGLAVVADGNAGLHVIDLSAGQIIGSVSTGGDARDVALSGDFAAVAEFSSSFTTVSLSNPANPVVLASTPQSTGGLLNDVAVAGGFAFGADVFFVNGVPIIDVTSPGMPNPRAILNFAGFRDDDGHGIAVDSNFVYLTGVDGSAFTQNGMNGDSRLYVGQYLALEDKAGIPPTVAITSPLEGDTVIEGSTIAVQAQAQDDVAVVAVDFLVNGLVAFTDTSAPYEFSLTVPAGASTLVLAASAIDLGGNIGTTEDVLVNVIPDPGTTLAGTVVDGDGAAVAMADVTCLTETVQTDAGGAFSIPGLPTILGNIGCAASALRADGVTLFGRSQPVAPVPGGIADVGQIVVFPGFPNGNGGFETGDFTGFSVAGETAVIQSLGPVTPPQGDFMAFLSTGGAAVGASTSTITTDPFLIPAGVNFLTFEFNFLSDEFPNFVGSAFNDTLQVVLTTSSGEQVTTLASVNTSSFVEAGATGFNGMTGFNTIQLDVSSLTAQGVTCTLDFQILIFDQGDTGVDSAGLIDNLRFE